MYLCSLTTYLTGLFVFLWRHAGARHLLEWSGENRASFSRLAADMCVEDQFMLLCFRHCCTCMWCRALNRAASYMHTSITNDLQTSTRQLVDCCRNRWSCTSSATRSASTTSRRAPTATSTCASCSATSSPASSRTSSVTTSRRWTTSASPTTTTASCTTVPRWVSGVKVEICFELMLI